MTDEIKQLYNDRVGRYQAVIALEPTDRVPMAFGSNYFGSKNSGYNYQQITYESELWVKAKLEFSRRYPEVDAFRINYLWSPVDDAVDYRLMRIPGRDISPKSVQQFEEKEYMKADEYRMLIDDPVGFRMDRYLPRVLGEFGERGSVRSYMAFLKSGMLRVMAADNAKERVARAAHEVGLPPTTMGAWAPPFDYLSDKLRGLSGIMKDMFRQPDNVIEACEALLPDLVNNTLASADPRFPIMIATHKPCFMSPKQFEMFYWPTFKKGIMMLIEAGFRCRVLLEGNWTAHWHYMVEFPKGKVLCDIDNEADIFAAKKAIGHQQCITGGIPVEMLILGSPDEVRSRVKLLCETVGKDGGWMPHGGTNIPEDTKPENFRALLDAVMEYGRYSDGPAPAPKLFPDPVRPAGLSEGRMITPWEIKKTDWSIPGDEDMVRKPWETLEKMAYNWMLNW